MSRIKPTHYVPCQCGAGHSESNEPCECNLYCNAWAEFASTTGVLRYVTCKNCLRAIASSESLEVPMKQTPGDRLATLAVAYAQHRTKLHANAKAIKQLQDDSEGTYFDLTQYRDRYWNDRDVHDLQMGEVIVWHGWVHAIEQCEPDKDHEEEECGYWATAKLMDARREIKRDGARIRAAITKIGNQLLKVSQ